MITQLHHFGAVYHGLAGGPFVWFIVVLILGGGLLAGRR